MAYNSFTATPQLHGSTGTGLDQIVDVIASDSGLAGRITGLDIGHGAAAANAMNALIVEAVEAVGAAQNGTFTVDDVLAINAWLRADSERYNKFVEFHGDDEGRVETGFHLVQSDGAVTPYRGANFINTVVDGIFHIGFEVQNGRFLNEDGNPNASVAQVAEWLTQLWTDHSTTGTGLDRMTDLIMADRGLDRHISDAEIVEGAEVANALNQMIADAIHEMHLDADAEISVADVEAINAWINADQGRYGRFVELHGNDEGDLETGFHVVQGDGASTARFGQNFVNTVLDGIYHIGFTIENGRFLNEDGKANATVSNVASWLDYFYSDVSTTGTGLDWLVDSIKSDTGLALRTSAADINAGARAANGLNTMIVAGIEATGIGQDGEFSVEDMFALNTWFNADAARHDQFVLLHGDDENGLETGFHLVQGDGGTLRYHGQQLINTVADGIYHIGFDIVGENLVNEDGDQNAALSSVATWLNSFYFGASIILGTNDGNALRGTDDDDVIYGRGGNDQLLGGDGNDRLDGGDGCDVADGGQGDDILLGGAGKDTLRGGLGNDVLQGGQDNDILAGGEGDDDLSGGDGADKLSGGEGNDILRGGAGLDILQGGSGSDRFVFDTPGGAGNADRIADFQTGLDKLVFAKDVFTALGGDGVLNQNEFVYGRKAIDADDHILYDRGHGNVYYDADGVGGVDAVLIATLNKGTVLAASDFMLV